MKEQCFEFRSRLSSALEGTGLEGREAQVHKMQSLGWHEHLLQCTECRQLLEGEQILEELLDSLPTPALTSVQRTQLVQRLAENLRLERLLDAADPFVEAPKGLSDRIISGVRSAQFDGVPASKDLEPLDDHLAALDSIPTPVGLAGRVMRHCQDQTSAPAPDLIPSKQRASQGPKKAIPMLRHWLSTGLVAASLAAILWYLPGKSKADPRTPENFVVETNGGLDPDVDAEVLALLDTLEVMDLVDELDAEEWDLVDQYDSYALFLVDETQTTDGDAR